MNTIDKEEILKAIDQVQASAIANVILIANNEKQAKMFEEMLPGVKVLCANGRLESDDKVYILPCEEKPIKFIYE